MAHNATAPDTVAAPKNISLMLFNIVSDTEARSRYCCSPIQRSAMKLAQRVTTEIGTSSGVKGQNE
jgi:hypothetical protein